jgi:hypothetical protein
MRSDLAVSGTVLDERPDKVLQPFRSAGANQSEMELDMERFPFSVTGQRLTAEFRLHANQRMMRRN